jgi:DNA end-binding protein Ku
MARKAAQALRHRRRARRAAGSRPIWKGSLSFGLVNIPVSLHPAETSNDLGFKLLDRRDLSPVHYQRVNEKTGKEVPWDEVVKGYEYVKGEYVPMSEMDFERANTEATQTIEITDFVDAAEIAPVYYDRPYYLAPAKNAGKSYALLRETIRKTKTVGIAQVVIRSRQHLAAVLPRDSVLVLNILRFAHEIRDPENLEIPENISIGEKELKMAERLVETMVGKWQPEKYRDEYREDLLALIERKVKAGKTKVIDEAPPREPRRTAKVIDIMDLLKRSVEQAGHREEASRRRRKTG